LIGVAVELVVLVEFDTDVVPLIIVVVELVTEGGVIRELDTGVLSVVLVPGICVEFDSVVIIGGAITTCL
jgi:hypothetical protein